MIVRDNVDMHNCECIEFMKTMDDKSVELVIADIPYDEINQYNRYDLCDKGTELRSLNKMNADISTFDICDFVNNVIRVCAGSIYVFCGTKQISEIISIFQSHKFMTRLCVWHKPNPSPINGDYIWLSSAEFCVFAKRGGAQFRRHCSSSVWTYQSQRSSIHPTQKPLSLIEYLVTSSSSVGDLVFDPCFGSGTTAVACMLQGRKFIGCELDKGYYDVAVQRVKDTMIPNKLFG